MSYTIEQINRAMEDIQTRKWWKIIVERLQNEKNRIVKDIITRTTWEKLFTQEDLLKERLAAYQRIIELPEMLQTPETPTEKEDNERSIIDRALEDINYNVL